MPYKDPEQKRQQARVWAAKRRAENPEEHRQRMRDWRAKNPERDAENAKRWKETNPEKIRQYSIEGEKRRQSDPERIDRKRKQVRERMRTLRIEDPLKIMDSKLRSTYGISLEQFEELERFQKHGCAICQKPERMMARGKICRLAVDHCHESGEVRGLLCSNCNNGLGRFQHDLQLLERALEYLKKPPASEIVKIS